MAYWYNINTGQVEEDGHTSRKENLMGPYPTIEQATAALDRAKERTQAWDEEDQRRAQEDDADR
ncbi:hypothetical protein KEM60_02640 [Austwickia sp. TVS 96-490-7B]|uniref:methionine aminopeptidase n=1 Tax=Austwickia sp. TVS 96-490-7B TaxID=2830843 RepID=UPI001C56EAD4|nr:methionine aminopeptidase [Austwickia sp. TVS 96-490-7B]MBW3086422.1 hypothetical protein [Austwickia sp. TVS 96-490-7B]